MTGASRGGPVDPKQVEKFRDILEKNARGNDEAAWGSRQTAFRLALSAALLSAATSVTLGTAKYVPDEMWRNSFQVVAIALSGISSVISTCIAFINPKERWFFHTSLRQKCYLIRDRLDIGSAGELGISTEEFDRLLDEYTQAKQGADKAWGTLSATHGHGG